MPFRRVRRSKPGATHPANLNLTPLMNLFVTMIPLLLLTAAFYHIRMVSASVPVRDGSGGGYDGPVTVGVRITEKGYRLTATSNRVGEEALEELGTFIPKRNGEYDYQELSRFLERVKLRHLDSDSIILTPARSVEYQALIETLDAARSMERTIDGKQRKFPLFPRVVVGTLVE